MNEYHTIRADVRAYTLYIQAKRNDSLVTGGFTAYS